MEKILMCEIDKRIVSFTKNTLVIKNDIPVSQRVAILLRAEMITVGNLCILTVSNCISFEQNEYAILCYYIPEYDN